MFTRHMKHYILSFLVFLTTWTTVWADEPDSLSIANLPSVPQYVSVSKTIYHGDSIIHLTLVNPLYIYPQRKFKSKRRQKRYTRMVYNIKKTLPYAKLARQTIIETFEYIQTLPSEKARKKHIKLVERELVKTYTPIMKRLSKSQGRMLIKLIDRECNQTGLSIARAFLGPLRANFYQSIAFLFGHSLARNYDPKGKDQDIERAVLMIESGQL